MRHKLWLIAFDQKFDHMMAHALDLGLAEGAGDTGADLELVI